MSTPPITGWMPKVSAEPKPDEVHRLFTLAFQKLGNHATAFGLLKSDINSFKAGSTKTVVEGGLGGSSTPPVPVNLGIPVNNQSGVTTYATVAGDDGSLIVLSDASPIAVTLSSQSPPWSCFINNIGAGTATLTPATGTISYAGNPGAATMPIASGGSALVAFDGTNWWAELSISSTGPAGVTQIVAGTNVTISPVGGTGVVTVNASGGGSSYIKGTVTVAASGTSGTFRGTGTVTGAGATMAAIASAPALVQLCSTSPVSWACDVVSTNTVEVQVTLPNIGATWSNITFQVVVFP
jgi:hypothetical protein